MVGFDIQEVEFEKNFEKKVVSILNENFRENRNIAKLTFFVNCVSNDNYKKIKTKFGNIIANNCNKLKIEHPCISLVAQKNANGYFCNIEILYFEKCEIIFKESEHLRYCLVSNVYGSFIITSSTPLFPLTKMVNANAIINQIVTAFKCVENILLLEGFDFSEIIRQWTYIENVLFLESNKDGGKQFYQIYNDVRSAYFEKYNFHNGYMAATGIGVFSGIITTEIIAYKRNPTKGFKVFGIKNPKQKDAYDYSEKKLIGAPLEGYNKKTTPKFERAKLLESMGNCILFISGTSSVIGEDTVNIGFTIRQTETTLSNIDELINSSNLVIQSEKKFSTEDIQLLRIYIKNQEDYLTIKSIIDLKYPKSKSVYLIASICRNDLNIEIEGFGLI